MKTLAYTSPARGDLYPIVPAMVELIARGGEACVCTMSAELEHMHGAGLAACAIDPAIERLEIEDWRKATLPGAARSVLRTFSRRARYEAADLTREIARQDPDALLIDINCWGAATAAEASGRPWAIYSPYLVPLPSRDAPPYGVGLRPLTSPLGAIRDAIARRCTVTFFDRPVMRPINELRGQHGLSPLARFGDLLAQPELLLLLTAEGFEYPRSDWPANARLVGPIGWAPPAPVPEWLSELKDPLILVTCSTERQGDERLVEVALKALPSAGMSVIATAAAHDPDAFDAPTGSRVVRFLPHEAILGRAACVICHGGLGITQKALAAGVPVVVVPFGRDQLETARRVEVAQAGVWLPPRRLTAARLTTAVDAAIARGAGARRISRAFAAAGGLLAAADAIERIARPTRPQAAA